MGATPHMLSTQSIKETQNYPPFQKSNWEKKTIRTELWMKKYITYIYIYNQVISACKMMIFTQNDWSQRGIIKKYYMN